MTAIAPMIESHVEYLCDEAEHWLERAEYWTSRGNKPQAAYCMEQMELSERRAMAWAEKLENAA